MKAFRVETPYAGVLNRRQKENPFTSHARMQPKFRGGSSRPWASGVCPGFPISGGPKPMAPHPG